MNLLKGTNCYTIGQLQHGCFDYAKEWRAYLQEQFNDLGIKILSPLDRMFRNFPAEGENLNNELKQALKDGKYDWVHEQMKRIRSRDLAACDFSTFLIAVLDPNKITWGATDEIITAKRNQKPVFLVIPEKGYSEIPLWLSSYFRPNWVYKDLDEVINVVKKIDLGEIEINSKYWKILDK